MNILNYFKKLSIFDYIIGVLFIIITTLSIILFGPLGLLSIPILLILITIYFKSNEIATFIKELINIDKVKKDSKQSKDNKNIKTNKNIENIKKSNKKNSKNSIDSYFEDDDIILKDEIKEKINEESKEKDNIEEKRSTKVVMSKSNVNKKKPKTKAKTKPKDKDKTKTKNIKKKILKVFLTCFLTVCIVLVLAAGAFMAYIVVTTEDFDPNKLKYQDQSLVYDKNGNVFTSLGTEKRESVTYDELPQVLIDAIIATEDSRFFEHKGVDILRFLKASVGQVLHIGGSGGASTLTMQVSKNNLTSTESQGLEGIIRKFRDVYISVFQIEKEYTKEQIIEFYVNDNLLGGSNWGVEQASQYYFGKSVSELSLAEASTLAGIFQTPNKYRPDFYPERAEKRRETVLNLMVKHGYITEEEAEATKQIPVSSLVVSHPENETYKAYLETVVQEIEDKLDVNPYTTSLKIYTSLDTSIQNGIDKIMNGETYTWENDVVQAGIAVIDVNTGQVVAIGAGRDRDEAADRTWNYATQNKKHPGSTAKPIFDYGPGFEYSNYSTYTLFNDEPWTYTNGPSVNNWDGGFKGLMTLRDALAQSRNIPALKAFQQNNKQNIKSFVTSLGITPESDFHEAHAIGGFTGASPLEMSAAYAAFANGGYYIEPHTVIKVEYRDTGKVEEFKYTKERVMKESTAFMINNVLQYAVENGSDGGARVYGKTVAAKTGTSNHSAQTIKDYHMNGDAVNDLWTCAYTPEYSFSLWYGYDELSSEYYNTNVYNGGLGYKNRLMSALVKVIPMTTTAFNVPDTVIQKPVEFGTWPAQLPSDYTPSNLIRNEYFVKGTEPTETSKRFDKFNDINNVSTDKSTSTSLKITWNYKFDEIFTESYLKNYFSQTVFGNGRDTFVNERLNYFGGVGFAIYGKDKNNNLELIDFTTDTEFTYSKNSTSYNSKYKYIVIKVKYKDYTSNESNGYEVKIPFASSIIDNDNKESLTTDISSNEASYILGNFKEKNITVKYKGKVITDTENLTIEYTIPSENINTTSKDEFEQKVNSLTEAKSYKIIYKITYINNNKNIDETIIANKTISLKK